MLIAKDLVSNLTAYSLGLKPSSWLFSKVVTNMLVFLGASCLAGCGIQLGKYSSSGSFFDPLKPDFGIISIDRGTPALRSSEKSQNLLAVILWCPGLETGPPSGSSQTNGTFVTTRKFWWTTGSGSVDFTYSWNRVSDKVTIAGRQFDRTNGNGFVVLRKFSGRWSVRQVSDIPPWDDARGVLRAFQRKLPRSDFVADLSIPFVVENE